VNERESEWKSGESGWRGSEPIRKRTEARKKWEREIRETESDSGV